MHVFLIVLFSIIGIFVVMFVAGIITAVTRNNGKQRRANAMARMSQIPDTLRQNLINIFREYKNEDVAKTNALVVALEPTSLEKLLTMAKPENRPKHLTSGIAGDETLRSAMVKALVEKGYSSNASNVIVGIFLHDFDGVLSEIVSKNIAP